jgi:Fe-S oxidoreductase
MSGPIRPNVVSTAADFIAMMQWRSFADEKPTNYSRVIVHRVIGKQSYVDVINYITEEEIRACTTCQACVEACPVSISPLDIIVQLRRYQAMEESNVPQEWTAMFSNTENNFAPWKFSPDDRDAWTQTS